MKNYFPTDTQPALVGGYAILLAILCGCTTSTPARMGGATEYLPETEVIHHQEAATTRTEREDVSTRSSTSQRAAKPAVSNDIAASPSSQSKRPKKVESEIGKTSDIQIDDETRQRMNAGSDAKTADSARKQKGKKVESEIRDASDLQIDEQTKQKMDEPR